MERGCDCRYVATTPGNDSSIGGWEEPGAGLDMRIHWEIMYNRKRVARGVGAALAVWGLIGMIVMSTGVAFATPIAGIGGFNIIVGEATADSVYVYPGVDDATNASAYPMAVLELDDADFQELIIYKNIDSPVFPGQSRVIITSNGPVQGGDTYVKASALTADNSLFRDFTLDETNTNETATAFQITAESETTLQNTGLQAHYLATNRISLNELTLRVCHDRDNDGVYEWGTCPIQDPVGEGIEVGGGIDDVDTGLPDDVPESQEDDDEDNFTAGDIVEGIKDAVDAISNLF